MLLHNVISTTFIMNRASSPGHVRPRTLSYQYVVGLDVS